MCGHRQHEFGRGRHRHGREGGQGFGFGRAQALRDWAFGEGARARRGDVKYFILEVLADGPRHGYDVIAAMEAKSGGRYRPSPGSVYPTLQLLEDGGFATSETVDGKRVYTITDAGRALLQEKGPAPAEPERPESEDLRGAFMQLAQAVRQAAGVSPPDQHAKLREILVNARREVYKLLAEAD